MSKDGGFLLHFTNEIIISEQLPQSSLCAVLVKLPALA
jgi:hypothetical protein